MVDEKESADGPVSFLPKASPEKRRISPIPPARMVVLILSAAVGVWLAHGVLIRFPHGFAAYLLAAFAFLFSVEMGAGIAMVVNMSVKAIGKAVNRRFGAPRQRVWNAQMENLEKGTAESPHPFPR
jgi:hypothetical protein